MRSGIPGTVGPTETQIMQPIKSTRDFAAEAFDVAIGLFAIIPPKDSAGLDRLRELYIMMFEKQIEDRDEATRAAVVAVNEKLGGDRA